MLAPTSHTVECSPWPIAPMELASLTLALLRGMPSSSPNFVSVPPSTSQTNKKRSAQKCNRITGQAFFLGNHRDAGAELITQSPTARQLASRAAGAPRARVVCAVRAAGGSARAARGTPKSERLLLKMHGDPFPKSIAHHRSLFSRLVIRTAGEETRTRGGSGEGKQSKKRRENE